MKNNPFFSAPVMALTLTMTSLSGSELIAPIYSDKDSRTYTFTIPAPRGQILDRFGNSLARNRSAAILALRLLPLTAADPVEESEAGWEGRLISQAIDRITQLQELSDHISIPSDEQIVEHWKHRRWLPLQVSAPFEWEEFDKDLVEIPGATLETIVLREYPEGTSGCHLIGYVSRESPLPSGEVRRGELLWPRVRGRAGLELTYDEQLTGQDGTMSVVVDEKGYEIARFIIQEPVPGLNVVTTLNRSIMKLASETLRKANRRGAIVAIDAPTGDILAMTSWPEFDPNTFVPSIGTDDFRKLRDDPGAPLFGRAYSGAYPPGSAFKPVVAMAALQSRTTAGTRTLLPGPTSVEIDGRTFHNWSDEHEGLLDVRGALIRSCNTWFYQAGIQTGATRIIDLAERFGLGTAPELPLQGVTAGNLPSAKMSRQGTANLSIGQGELLASPLQMAVCMAGFANESYLPSARLVMSVQTPENQVVDHHPVSKKASLYFAEGDLNLVHAGMYGVVNHPRGTAGRAALAHPKILGKTGTAQWAQEGKDSRLYWFCGFAHTRNPRLAFAVLCEGRDGERKYSSEVSVPVAATFLKELYGNPGKFGISLPDRYYAKAPGAWEVDDPLGPPKAIEAAESPQVGRPSISSEFEANPAGDRQAEALRIRQELLRAREEQDQRIREEQIRVWQEQLRRQRQIQADRANSSARAARSATTGRTRSIFRRPGHR